MKKFGFALIVLLGVGVGLYPVLYFLIDMSGGFLSTKSDAVLASKTWRMLFNQHIIFGGIALTFGWLQFLPRLRARYVNVHRALGRVYVVSCLLSGIAGLYIAVYATGGVIAALGFGGLAVSWLYSTVRAYVAIRNKQVETHRRWMIRSYALTFAAATLRGWLPLSQVAGLPFEPSYVVISWLCWVPNLFVAEYLIRQNRPAVTFA